MRSIRETGQDAGAIRRQIDGPTRTDARPGRLPDLCNLGVWLRVLLGVNLGAFAAALARNRELASLPRECAELAAFVEPAVLASLLALCALNRWLKRLGDAAAVAVAVALPAAIAAGVVRVLGPLAETGAAWRAPLWAAVAAGLLLAWFDLRRRAHAPAVTEARLLALTARIRPHFFFNSLNAVLGVMRSDPRRAEAALEELSELFRALMRDNRELVPLSEEIALARQYLELEKLRLGERLHVRWDVESCPPDALVPPLMLQPLLENAVYHGIEPLAGQGEIRIRISRAQDRVTFELANPYSPGGAHTAGNQMALANIRERLMLFFDLEAQLATRAGDGEYVVGITFPYRRKDAP